MRSTRAAALTALLICGRAQAAPPAPVPSFHELPTGNGFGFAVFDTEAHKIAQLLERPYRFLAPGPDPHRDGVYRRDLAYDIYFGARAGGIGTWLPDRPQDEVGYVEQTNIIRSVSSLGTVRIESFYFAPFGLDANALILVARATNTGASTTTVDLFALPNLRLGGGNADEPSADGETIATSGLRTVETGALGESGGALVYLPLSPVAKADCTGGWSAVKAGGELASDTRSCTGNDLTLIYQSTPLSLAPGASASFGLIIGFAPAASGANALGDTLATFVAGRPAEQLLTDALAEWASWRKPPPAALSADELRVYRQGETTLRMAQVREPYREVPKQKGHGMILASLPPGIWNIGWVRDATYAIVALARSGHIEEAKDALRFFLAAEGNQYASYTNGPYRISVTRYFGNGQEESDWNSAGPNIEFDGWGLFLWALRQTLDAAGDGAFLEETLATKEKVLDVVRSEVEGAIVRNLEPSGLMLPDTSIWESHWDNRRHYAYTSLTAARGLCDLAAIEQSRGEVARAELLRTRAGQLRAAIRANLLDGDLVLGGSKEGVEDGVYHDAAVLEAFNWELFSATDPLYPATLSGLDRVLKLPSGGWKRNDDGLSKYDSYEWIMIDMRAAQAFRRQGDAARSDELIAWVTAQGRANFDLIPELFNVFPEDGPMWAFAGATPMVGFGAGAYMLALRDRAGDRMAHDCGGPLADGGTTDGGAAPPDSPGCGCAIGAGRRLSCATLAMIGLGGAAVVAVLRRRRRARPSA